MILHFTFYFVLSFLALLSTDWVSLNFQKWMLLHFAFYTLLHPMGHKYSIGINEDSRVNCFTFYILHCSIFSSVAINWFGKLKFSSMDASFILPFTPYYGRCVTNIPSSLLKTQELMILHFTFYFVISFLALLSTDWVSLNFQKHFVFHTLLHLMGHNCSIRLIEDSRVNEYTFLHFTLCYLFMSCY